MILWVSWELFLGWWGLSGVPANWWDGLTHWWGGLVPPPPAGMAHLFSMWPLILQSPGLLHAVKSKSDAQLVFKSVIVSHLLLSSWQKQLTRPSPESVWEGSTQGQRRKLQWHLCKWFIPRSHCHYGFLGENLLEIAIFWEDPPLIMGPRYTQL